MVYRHRRKGRRMMHRRIAATRPRRPIPAWRWLVLSCLVAAPFPAFAAPSGGSSPPDREICWNVLEGMKARAPMTSAPLQRLAQAEAPVDDEQALADELAEMLQACSYDGTALEVSAASLAGAEGSAGEAVVGEIMRFTGLPQNFKVIEGRVPNAAAMILLGPDKLPQRVIAYNAAFLERVRTATANDDWAAVSILAHEIGHHLSGHTLVPGGSQPPIELEADRFSGFVLFRMGAALADAQKAISALIPVADGPTHPGRPKRLAAVEAGWTASCGQSPAAAPAPPSPPRRRRHPRLQPHPRPPLPQARHRNPRRPPRGPRSPR